jgi:hypothetical protein
MYFQLYLCTSIVNEKKILETRFVPNNLCIMERTEIFLIIFSGQWRVFTGNELGALFGWWFLTSHRNSGEEAGRKK